MNEKKYNKTKYIVMSIIIILTVSVIMTLYYGVQVCESSLPFDSDDAGTFIHMRDIVEYGSEFKYHNLDIFYWIVRLIYGILGESVSAVIVDYAVRYGITIFFMFLLALIDKKGKAHWQVLPILFFVTMPGNFGIASCKVFKYHIWASFISLLIALIICYVKNIKNKEILICILISIWGIVEGDILVITSAFIPLVVLLIINNLTYLKYNIKKCLMLFIILVILAKLILSKWNYLGYGASFFPSVNDILNNVIVGVEGLLGLFNISIVASNIFSYSFLESCLRLLIILYFIICVVKLINNIIKGNHNNNSLIENYLAIVWSFSIIGYLFGGKREDEVAIRYMLMFFYTTIIVGIWNTVEFMDKYRKYFYLKKINILSVLFIILCLFSVGNINFKIDNSEDYSDIKKTAYFINENEKYKNGLGSFWRAGSIEVVTNGENCVQSVEINENDKAEPYLMENVPYYLGNKDFNFFVEHKQENHGINEENLIKYYGNYTEKKEFDNSTVYLYDYDVRTKPLKITSDSIMYLNNIESNTKNIELQDQMPLEIRNINMTIGIVTLKINTDSNVNDIVVQTNLSDKVEIYTKDNQIYADIYVETYSSDRKIIISNKSEACVNIKSITIVKKSNSILLDNCESYNIKCGTEPVYIGIYGENVKDKEMIFENVDDSVSIVKDKAGKSLVMYKVTSSENSVITLKLEDAEGVSEVFYQNGIYSDFNIPNIMFYTNDTGMIYDSDNKLYYGPYVSLKEGTYEITVRGNNLSISNINLTSDCGVNINQSIVSYNEKGDMINIKIKVDDIEAFECVINNVASKKDLNYVEIKKIEHN